MPLNVPEWLALWHPAWVITLGVCFILAWRSPNIINAIGQYHNEKRRLNQKHEIRSRKLRNAVQDVRNRQGKGS